MHKELLRTAGVFVFLQSATEMERKDNKTSRGQGQEEGRRGGQGAGEGRDLLFSHSGTVNRWIGTGW